jgi:hypothetical protein
MGHGYKSGPGGCGGVGAVLTVTAPAGVTVSVSKDGKTKTKTANADGLAVFKGLATGTWTLTITNGVQTSTKPVVITADYDTVIAFFSATINITYPSGSTCTCSDGSTTFTAPDTSGTWVCIVPNTGTWTVSCTNGTESTSETVKITTDGQTTYIELTYAIILFDAEKLTDTEALAMFGNSFPEYAKKTKEGDYIVFTHTAVAAAYVTFYLKTPYDITDMTTLIVEGYSTQNDSIFGVAENQPGEASNQPTWSASEIFGDSQNEWPLEISTVPGKQYVCFSVKGGKKIYLKAIKLLR